MLSKGDSAESSDDETSDILDSLTECIQKGQTKISSVYSLHPKNEPYKQSEVFDLQIKWEKKHQDYLNKKYLKEKIRCGLIIRSILEADNKCPTDIYLEKVKCKNHALVEALLNTSLVNPSLNLNKNACNNLNKSALEIAVENEDVEMCELLLKNQVLIRDCLFHAIDRNFLAGIKAILSYDKCTKAQILGDNFYFPAGITPFRLAAWKNNYQVLKILHENGHNLDIKKAWWEGTICSWESGNDRIWFYETKSSSAYVILMHEIYHRDPFEICMETIESLKKQAKLEPMYNERYVQLQNQMEQFMCDLLSEIRSSEELAHLFEYNFIPIKNTSDAFRMVNKTPLINNQDLNTAKLIDRACENNLEMFVTHQNSQLAIDYLKFRFTPFLHSSFQFRDQILKFMVGLLFPILSLFYIINPKSKLGRLMTFPQISFCCHMVSDFIFIILLMINLKSEANNSAYLGKNPNLFELVVVFWILGKWYQEAQELFKRGSLSYFSDWWNYNDICFLTIFTAGIIFRIIDWVFHHNDKFKKSREDWEDGNPRLTAEILFACAYVFMCLRILGILRTDRTLGPLQVSLSKMCFNIYHFLIIFVLIVFSFSMGFTELFSYYGTKEGEKFMCKLNATTYECQSPYSHLFSTLEESLDSLFWYLFGQIDVPTTEIAGKHKSTAMAGYLMLIIYHIIAVIVLINMLIAMMALTFEETSSRSEMKWKFHRTVVWVRFIGKEAVRPPPFNIIPSSSSIRSFCCNIWKKIFSHKKKKTNKDENEESKIEMVAITSPKLNYKMLKKGAKAITRGLCRKKRNIVLEKLVRRYKFKVLLK